MELTNLPGVHDRHITTTTATATTTTSTKDKQSSEILPTHYITKLPNLVAINSIAYDSTTHDKDKEEEYYRGYVHNMIRWRYTTTTTNNNDGGNGCESIVQRESNARVVKWSDGTYTLHVGNEILEVDTIDGSIPIGIDPTAAAEADAEQKQMTTSNNNNNNSTISFPGNNGYLYVSQKARICQPKEEDDNDNEDDNENNIPLYTYQPAGTVLECIAPITARLVPRPSSLASDAHRNLTLAVRQRNVKRARITEIVTEVDPEKEKMARIKGKEDLERSRARGGGGGGVGGSGRRSNGGGGGSSRKGGMNQDYLEDDDDDDYDGVNVSNIKKQTRQKHSKKKNNDDSDEEMDYGDDDDDTDDDDDDGWLAKKNKTRGASSSKAATTKRILEDGEVDFGDDDDDDDDEEETAFVSKKKKSTAGKSGSRNAFLSDDDEDD